MSEATNISWADSTWNPWRGCTKVSPGCVNCYAEKLVTQKRMGGGWGKGAPRVRSKTTFNDPLKWNKNPWVCGGCGMFHENEREAICLGCVNTTTYHRRRVFLGSLMDWLDPEVPIEWLADAMDIVRRCPDLIFQMVTKRPELWYQRMLSVEACISKLYLGDDATFLFIDDWIKGTPPPNVWIITSVEDQRRADERIPHLLKIPAVVHGLSVEPLLEPVEFSNVSGRSDAVEQLGKKSLSGIDWLIIGGESGPGFRDCGVAAIEDVASQCRAVGVGCYVKQDAGRLPGKQGRLSSEVWSMKQFPK